MSEHPELEESRVPWREGRGYRLVDVRISYDSTRPEFEALTISNFSPNWYTLTRWRWYNYLRRDWSRGDGEWEVTAHFSVSRMELEAVSGILV